LLPFKVNVVLIPFTRRALLLNQLYIWGRVNAFYFATYINC